MNVRERKKEKRRQLLILLNQDPNWHKKDNSLVAAIQNKAKEICYPDQEELLELTIDHYKELCEAGVPVSEMHRRFGLSKGRFNSWRKENGLFNTSKHSLAKETAR